jgi:peptidoglycan L-alanyl-D-glutamate endopeptidase CwlK
MSQQLFKNDILFLQRILSVSGIYSGTLDGCRSSALDAAALAFEEMTVELRASMGTFDQRTETNIATLLPSAQKLARRFMTVASSFDFTVRIICGTRTYAEQEALFAKRPKVTHARGGQSNHNFGIAWDVGLFDAAGRYLTGNSRDEVAAYGKLAKRIKAKLPGLEWGGDWTSFKDLPHYQLVTDKTLRQVRTLFELGRSYLPADQLRSSA